MNATIAAGIMLMVLPLAFNAAFAALAAKFDSLRILERGGIAGDAAVATFSGIIGLNYGWASFVITRAGGAGESLAEDLADPGVAQAFPLTASVAGPMSRYGSAEHYELVLAQLFAGIPAGAGAT